MSTSTALGRFFELAPGQLKTYSVGSVRCNSGCILANALEIDRQRFLLVHVHSKNKLVKHGQPDGLNGVAPRAGLPGLTVEKLERLSPMDVLELLRTGDLKEENLEELYRASGGNVARIAYLASVETFKDPYSPDRFAACRHWSGYLPKTALYVNKRVTKVEELTE